MANAGKKFSWYQYKSNSINLEKSNIIIEKSVTLSINGEPWLDFMCTPVDLKPLAIGFLFNEGLIDSYDDIASTHLCDSNEIVDVWLHKPIKKPQLWKRTSGCTGGITSVDNYEAKQYEQLTHTNGSILNSRQVCHLISKLFSVQNIYRETGGVHTSALSDGEKIVLIAEDIGRHNTIDKLSGLCLIKNIEIEKRIIITTGRISSEMLQKSARMGATIVISRTSPSSLSIELAENRGVTLIGYARRDSFNIYTHPDRIRLSMIREEQIIN